MNYKELKEFCDEEIKKYPESDIKKYKHEIIRAKYYYDSGINLVDLLKETPNKISKRYYIPFLLGITDDVIDKDLEYKFVTTESSGGVDIDMDFDPEGRNKIYDYLIEKFGDNRVLSVGTFSRLGPASAAKDLLRIYKINYQESNNFTKTLQKELSWKENIENIQENFPDQYKFYERYKTILDLVPHFINKIRQSSKHAGGIVITDRPFYELIPVDRVTSEVVTAFPESAQEQVLDKLGITKFDVLRIEVLEIIKNTINNLKDRLFLVEEDEIKKIVTESYLEKENFNNENISTNN